MSCKRVIVSLLMLSLIFALAGCLSNFLPTAPAVNPAQDKTGVLYLQPAQLTTAPSENFEVDLKVGEVVNLKGYSVTLSYDPAHLCLNKVQEGTFFSSEGETFFYHKIDDKKGTVLIDCAILGRNLAVSGEGDLSTLSFTALKAGSSSLSFKLTRTRDTRNQEIITSKQNAVVKCKK